MTTLAIFIFGVINGWFIGHCRRRASDAERIADSEWMRDSYERAYLDLSKQHAVTHCLLEQRRIRSEQARLN